MAISTVAASDKFGVWRARTNQLIDRINAFGTSNNVTITGGTIDGTPIGESDPDTGHFTVLTLDTALAIDQGGTGQTTAQAARNALLPSQTGNADKFLKSDGTNASWSDLDGLDATLAAIAGLSPSSDNYIYFTGSDVATVGTITTFGRSLIDDADAETARATLGVVIGTNVQAQDDELAAIAGLTSAADKVPYFTGSGTAALATFTSFGRTLVAVVDQAAARTALALTPGTDVQTQDAELSALAGLTSAADRVPYFTGSGTAALATFTSFGRNLVDDADAAAGRSTLGLGTIATENIAAIASVMGISVSSASAALTITQTGAGNSLVIEDSTSTDATPFIVDTNGNLIVGDTSVRSFYGATSLSGQNIYLISDGTSNGGGVFALNFDNSTSAAAFVLGKSRGETAGSRTIINNADPLGYLYFVADDGVSASMVRAAYVAAQVDGTPGTGDLPARLVFATTPDGASAPTEKVRIDNAGRQVMGATSAKTFAASIVPAFQAIGATASTAGIGVGVYAADAVGGSFNFVKSRHATLGSQTVVNSGDVLGTINFGGSDGTDFELGAYIQATVDGTPGNNDMPGRLGFFVTPDGSATPAEGLRISNDKTIRMPAYGAGVPSFDSSGNISSLAQLTVALGGTGAATALANRVFAGPTSGSAAAPSFRALARADVPMYAYSAKSAGFNVTTADHMTLFDCTGTFTVNMPVPADSTGLIIGVKNASTGIIVVDSFGDSNSGTLFKDNYTSATNLGLLKGWTVWLMSTGTWWEVISDGRPPIEVITIAASDETTTITTGLAKVSLRIPFNFYATENPRASLSTVSSSGAPAFDINVGGASIFSTTLTIDANEKTSTTAATPAVVSNSLWAADTEITVDIDTAGTGAKGAKIYLIGRRYLS